MTGIVHAPIGDVGDALTILDAERRLYAALSRDGSYWHVIEPLQADITGLDAEVIRPAGQLACRCRGGVFHGTCYRVKQAEAFEAGDHRQATRALEPDWLLPRAALDAGTATFDAPTGAGELVEAFRG